MSGGLRPGPRALAEDVVERLGAVAGDADVVREPRKAQGAQREVKVLGVVLDEEDLDGAGRVHGVASAASVKKNAAPLSGSASAQILPPWRVTIRCAIASPTPVPS